MRLAICVCALLLILPAAASEPPYDENHLPPLMITPYTALNQEVGTIYVSIYYAPPGVSAGTDVVLTVTADPEVVSLPLYTGDDWHIPNDSQACAVRDSDLICDALTVPARVQLLLPESTRRVAVQAATPHSGHTLVWDVTDAPILMARAVLPWVGR